MSRYMPHETYPVRAAFRALGVAVAEAPECFDELLTVIRPLSPVLPIHRRLAARIQEFEHESEHLLMWLLWDIQHMIDVAVPAFIDVRDADALLAEAAYRVACSSRFSSQPAAEQAEVARWADFLADAYDARAAKHAQWDAEFQRRRNIALRGAATRRARAMQQ